MSSTQQPLNNTANADTTGLGNNSQKTTLGGTGTGYGAGNQGAGYGGNTNTGYGNNERQNMTGGGYAGNTGAGNGPISSADQYNTNAAGGPGPFGAGTGTEVRQNDAIAQPIDWAAINAGRGGAAGEQQYGLTGRAGAGGGVGQPANEDLSAADDPNLFPGGLPNNSHTGRHLGEGAVAGGVAGHELNKHDERRGGAGDHHVGRDAAVGGVGAAGLEHEHRRHENENLSGNQQGGDHHYGRDAAIGGVGAAGLEHEHRRHQNENAAGYQQGGGANYDSTHPNAGRHGAEAGVLAGGVGGHQDGHTVRDAALGGAAGGTAGHELHQHDQNRSGNTNYDDTTNTNTTNDGQKPGLVQKIKNIIKPHNNPNDPANEDVGNTNNAGGGAGLGTTGPGSTTY